MVDTQLLEDAICMSGKKKCYLADKLGITVQSLRLKMKNKYPFNTDEVTKLCEEVGIKRITDKERIFFAKNVDEASTSSGG